MQKKSSEKNEDKFPEGIKIDEVSIKRMCYEKVYHQYHPACLDPFLLQDKIITVKHRATGNLVFQTVLDAYLNTKSCACEFLFYENWTLFSILSSKVMSTDKFKLS